MNADIKIQLLATERKRKGLSKGKDQDSHITVQNKFISIHQ